MTIEFVYGKVDKLEFSTINEEHPQTITIDDDRDKVFDLDIADLYSEDEKKSFFIKFDILLINAKKYQLAIKYFALFKTYEDITEEFKNSHFTKINAPAIAFPFLRSFLSTFSINAGIEPILLPSINFTNYKNNSDRPSRVQP